MMIEGRDGTEDLFRDLRHCRAGPLSALVVVDEEMGRFNRLPHELRVVEFILRGAPACGEEEKEENCRRFCDGPPRGGENIRDQAHYFTTATFTIFTPLDAPLLASIRAK